MSNTDPIDWWWLALIVTVATLAVVVSACTRTVSKEPWETAPLSEEPFERVRLEEIAGLEIERVRFRSEAAGDIRFFIALIPNAERPIDEVVILSHGWGDRPELLLKRLDLAWRFSGLIDEGSIRPAIVVLPDVRFDAKYRRNSDNYPFPQYLGLIADEVYGLVSRLYSVEPDREKWHVGGYSFGGFLSLDVARRYSARVGSVSVISAFGDPEWSYWDETPPETGYLDEKGRGKHTVVAPGPVPRLLLACGTEDRFYPRMLRLHERLTDLELDHVWLTGPGGHNAKYWSTMLEPALRFHVGIAKAEEFGQSVQAGGGV